MGATVIGLFVDLGVTVNGHAAYDGTLFLGDYEAGPECGMTGFIVRGNASRVVAEIRSLMPRVEVRDFK